MKVNISFMFPKEYRFAHFLFDTANVMLHGLQDLGHHVILTRQLVDPDYLNVLIGAHTFDAPDSVQQLRAAKIPYVIVQTEVIRGTTINLTGETRFQQIYRPLLEGAAAVWDFYGSNQAALREQGIDSELLQLGYHPAMEQIRHKEDEDLDALFFGSVGERRAQVLQALKDSGVKLAVLFDDPAFFRNDMIARSKVQLSLRHDARMAHMPLGRIKYLVNNRCLVVGETGLESETVDDLMVSAEPEDFVEAVRRTIEREDRRELAERFYERYREQPMKAFLEPLMDRLP